MKAALALTISLLAQWPIAQAARQVGGAGQVAVMESGDAVQDSQAARGSASQVPLPEVQMANGDENMKYFLHHPSRRATIPTAGWKLLIVLPGGVGGPEITPFVAELARKALKSEWMVAQLVAPVWDAAQPEKVVWPTGAVPWPGMGFPCEQFVNQVVADVQAMNRIDPRCVFALAWSSSGNVGYAASLAKGSPITGTLIAMSDFHPKWVTDLSNARNATFYILHSPEDTIYPMSIAELAKNTLRRSGSSVELAQYHGDHGWRPEDVFDAIESGINSLKTRVANERGGRRGR